MLGVPGYQIGKRCFEGNDVAVYQGERGDSLPVYFKVVENMREHPEKSARLRNEYDILSANDMEGVICVYDLIEHDNNLILVLENFGGESLREILTRREFPLDEALAIALCALEGLAEIHRRDIIHKDINLSNIIYNERTGETRIIDFGIAHEVTRNRQSVETVTVLEGTLSHIAPEQTGRMNRGVDYRADLYAFGIVLYRLVTGKLPFTASDPIEMVHYHIAHAPSPPHEVAENVPPPLSGVILKLLSKTADDRYQSEYGLRHDLLRVREEYAREGHVAPFTPGEHDVSEYFLIPEKLYGRSMELDTLFAVYDWVCKGNKAVMQVTGFPGVGKSALVHELEKTVHEQHGWFVTGKCEQQQQTTPYAPLLAAFTKAIKSLLSEPEKEIARWKRVFENALGENANDIIEVIPDLARIMGEQPNSTPLAAEEGQNRFTLLFQSFVTAFASDEQPLLLFLDDLQFADTPTLQLLERIITNDAARYVFVIIAYRDADIGDDHPLSKMLRAVQEAGVIVQGIWLSALGVDEVGDMLADTLATDRERVREIEEICLAKTNGNPFFLKQFLLSLYHDRVFTFDATNGRWEWDTKRLADTEITDNVVTLMTQKIALLTEETQKALRTAACIGNVFSLTMLAKIMGESEKAMLTALWEPVLEGLLTPLEEAFRFIEPTLEGDIRFMFSHDRVQEAAYEMAGEEESAKTHLAIGRHLLGTTGDDEFDDSIFTITYHLNKGIRCVTDYQERIECAQMNIFAGKKAKASAAYAAAFTYFKTGIAFLGTSYWESNYDTMFDFHVGCAECAYLAGNYEEMETYASEALSRARTPLESITTYEVRIRAYCAKGEFHTAVTIALAAFRLLGVFLPKRAPMVFGLIQLGILYLRLLTRPTSALSDLPPLKDEKKRAALRILSVVGPAAFTSSPEYFPLITAMGCHVSLSNGICTDSLFHFTGYAALIAGLLQQTERAYAIGAFALNELENNPGHPHAAKILLAVSFFLLHWKKHLKETLAPLREGYQRGIRTGDFLYGGLCLSTRVRHAFYLGTDLRKMENETVAALHAFKKLKQDASFRYSSITMQGVVNLLKPVENPFVLAGEYFDEGETLSYYIETSDMNALFNTYLTKATIAYVFRDYRHAYDAACTGAKYRTALANTHTAMHTYFEALTALAFFPHAAPSERGEMLRLAKHNRALLRKWSKRSPENYLHRFHFVNAEYAVIKKNALLAMTEYDKGIALARKNEYINDVALMYERASLFYRARGNSLVARIYLLKAYHAYDAWGALGKMKALAKEHASLLEGGMSLTGVLEGSPLRETHQTRTTTKIVESFDFTSLLKATHIISSEIILDRLLEKMMRIAIENAGAQRGLVLLKEGERFLVEAEIDVRSDTVRLFSSHALEDRDAETGHPLLPANVVNYVIHAQEELVLRDAPNDEGFRNDRYILEYEPKSILCLPLLHKGTLTGIVYLEHTSATDAFSQERVAVLEMLSSQIATSIENARIYQQIDEMNRTLEEKVAIRTEELAEKNKAIMDSILYASTIQSAMLPYQTTCDAALGTHFIIWQPRDVVGGDFYWLETREDAFLFALVDCTGHGVPGAFMTMTANSVLNRVTEEVCFDNPARILSHVNSIMRTTLNQHEKRQLANDGMDIALCYYDGKAKTLTYAGAKISLYVSVEGTVREVKGDKQSVGYPDSLESFTYRNHTFPVTEETMFYLTTDGFIHQAGGRHQFPFGKTRLMRLLSSIYPYRAEEQLAALTRALAAYQGREEQRDDITLIAFAPTMVSPSPAVVIP